VSYQNTSGALREYTILADTSFVKQQIGTTLTGLDDTTVTYTPATGASKVIYECSCQISWDPDYAASIMCARLQYSTDSGGSWTTYTGSEMFGGNFSTTADYNWHVYMFVFQIPAWTGSRQLRLAARSHGASSEFTWGRSYNASGSEGVGACPIISVYSSME